MSLIVQKFGGSSVANAGKLLHISRIIKAARSQGHAVIVVVSAQGNTTDVLLQRAGSISPHPSGRELDALLSAGEQMAASLTAMCLHTQGVSAVSLAAWQLPIHSDSAHKDARITGIGRERVERELSQERVVVVAGFQGLDAQGDLTTLGRGGSDYTAVALAAAFHADRCLIYTDVDGVYTADPRLCPSARRLERISYEDMYALSRAGAQVLHDKCVALAQESGVEPEVRACTEDAAGTLVCSASGSGRVTGVTRRLCEDGALAAVTLVGAAVPSLDLQKPAILALSNAGIDVQGVDAGERTLTLYVEPDRSQAALCAVHDAFLT